MGDLSEHFSSAEFKCRCCGKIRVDLNLLQALEAIRAAVGFPIIVVSGYRCLDHNAKVGGAKRSYHTQGVAADITGRDLAAIYKAALAVPAIKGIGIYLRPGGWIHVDTRRDPARWAEDENRKSVKFADAEKILLARGKTPEGVEHG